MTSVAVTLARWAEGLEPAPGDLELADRALRLAVTRRGWRTAELRAAPRRPQLGQMERLIPFADAEVGQDLRALSLDGLKRARRQS